MNLHGLMLGCTNLHFFTDTLRDRAASVSTVPAASEQTPVKSTPVPKSVATLTPSASNSPPQSEASYDIVSGHVSTASESAAPAAKAPTKAPVAKADAAEEDDDDDDDDEDDEDEEEEESEESDWE